MPQARCRADLLADVQHGRFVALAFADDDGPADLALPRTPCAWLARRPDRSLLGALPHGAGGGDGGLFDDMYEIAGQIAFELLFFRYMGQRSHCAILAE